MDTQTLAQSQAVTESLEHTFGDRNKIQPSPAGIQPFESKLSAEAPVNPKTIDASYAADAAFPENTEEETHYNVPKSRRRQTSQPQKTKSQSLTTLKVTHRPTSKFDVKIVRPGGPSIDATTAPLTQSPTTTAFTDVRDQKQSPQAFKVLHLPFLQKFRSIDVGHKKNVGSNVSQGNVPDSRQELKSFFDDPSSDGEDHEDRPHQHCSKDRVFLGNAQQASFRRPVLVNHNSGTNSHLALKDILERGPDSEYGISKDAKNGRLASKFNSNFHDPTEAHEQQHGSAEPPLDIAGRLSTEQTTEDPRTAYHRTGKQDTIESSNSQLPSLHPLVFDHPSQDSDRNDLNMQPAVDGLRSHPTAAETRLTPRRQVTFPLLMEAIRGRNWEREDVICTPYPSGYTPNGEPARNKESDKERRGQARLTVVLYNRGSCAPKTTTLRLPIAAHHVPIKDSENGEVALMNKDFDDAALARSIHASYEKMRGSNLVKCSARVICDFRLLHFEDERELATRQGGQQCLGSSIEQEGEGFAETSLMALYRKPKIGHGKWQWWAWVRGLLGNRATGAQSRSTGFAGGRVALELIEGWSIKRILLALLFVVFCSFLAALLWIAAGVDHVPLRNTHTAAPTIATKNVVGTNVGPYSTKSGDESLAPSNQPLSNAVQMPPASYSGPTHAASLHESGPSPVLDIPGIPLGTGSVGPTMVQRDTPTTSTDLVSLRGSASTIETTASGSTQLLTLTMYQVDGAGSRVGSGAALGTFVLLVGCLIIGAWMMLSWMVG